MQPHRNAADLLATSAIEVLSKFFGAGVVVQERRKSARSRVFKGAKLILGTSSVIDCVVRNVTNVGARIQIANTVELPDAFGLTFDAGFTIRPCRIVWRSVTETGVEFCG